MDVMRLVHLGDFGSFGDKDTAGLIGNMDILFIPVGGVYTINYSEAAKLIKKLNPKDLPFKLTCKNSCESCTDLELCGGRCLYSNIYPVWPKKGVNEICITIKHLLKEMKRIQPEIEKLIKEGKIKKKDFNFLKYNCAEIIP